MWFAIRVMMVSQNGLGNTPVLEFSKRVCVELVLFPFYCLVELISEQCGLEFSLWQDFQLNYLMDIGLFNLSTSF